MRNVSTHQTAISTRILHSGNSNGSTTFNSPTPPHPAKGHLQHQHLSTHQCTPAPDHQTQDQSWRRSVQANFSQFQASGWVAENNSFVFTGNGSHVVIAPCNITTPNYSVTATIMLFKSQLGVGVIAHADSAGQAGYAAGSGCRNISFGRCGFFINDRFTDIMDIDQEAKLTGQTHTYKLVINGVTLKLYYDNNSIPIVSKSRHLPASGTRRF